MKKLLIFLLAIITVASLVACGTKKIDEIPEDTIIMTANYYPGGATTLAEYEAGCEEFTIYKSGKVTNKMGKEIQLSSKDTNFIYDCYDKFVAGNVKKTEGLICDYPSYSVTIDTDTDKIIVDSNANEQCDEVEEVLRVIFNYYD